MESPREVGIAVIGAGLAGLSLVHELYQSGVDDVELFEAGPAGRWLHKEMLGEARALRIWQVPATDRSFRRTWDTSVPPHYRRGSGIRRRLGGRSLYWHGVCLPIEHEVLRSGWPADIAEALSPRGPAPGLYARVRHDLETWRGGPLGDRQGDAQLMEALVMAGYPSAAAVPRASRRITVGGTPRWVPFTPLDYWRSATIGALLPPPRTGSRALTVREGTAGRVQITMGGRNGRDFVISARKAVLAAGTFENSRLVADFLMAGGSVGEFRLPNLTDHIVQGFVAVAPRSEVPFGHGRDAFCYIPACDSCRSNLFVEVAAHPCDEALIVRGWAMGEQDHPGSSIDFERIEGDLAMKVDVGLSARDMDVIRAQGEALTGLAAAVLPPHCPKVIFAPERFVRGQPSYMSALSRVLRASDPASQSQVFPYVYPLGAVDHEGGTLAFGDMVGLHAEVPQLPGLSVLGPCLFPRAGAANPSLTTLALAKRHASELAGTI